MYVGLHPVNDLKHIKEEGGKEVDDSRLQTSGPHLPDCSPAEMFIVSNLQEKESLLKTRLTSKDADRDVYRQGERVSRESDTEAALLNQATPPK